MRPLARSIFRAFGRELIVIKVVALFAVEAVGVDLLIDDARRDAQLFNRLPQQGKSTADAAPAVPLFNRQYLTLVSTRVENVQHHPMWGVLYDQLWVK